MEESGRPDSSRCKLTHCNCSCCDNRAGKHCGEHGNRCHVRCPY